MFTLSLLFSLSIAQEQPLTDINKRTDSESSTSIAVNEKLDQIHQAIVKQKEVIIPTTDLGYDSGSNYSNPEEHSLSGNSVGKIKSVSSGAKGCYSNCFSPIAEKTFRMPFSHLSVPIARLDSFAYYLCSRIYFYLPKNLKTFFEMPAVIKRLALANFFSWTAVMGFNLFYTDFVGQFVYGGNPNAEENSPLRILYDDGVRMASWGLLLHCITSAIYAVFIERLTERYGYLKTYLFGMFTFTLSMALMVFSRGIILVNTLAACTGIGYATLTTIPFMLITEYHACKDVSISNGSYIYSSLKKG
jgi:hypothetical protein